MKKYKIIKGTKHILVFRKCVRIKGKLRCAKKAKMLAFWVPLDKSA